MAMPFLDDPLPQDNVLNSKNPWSLLAYWRLVLKDFRRESIEGEISENTEHALAQIEQAILDLKSNTVEAAYIKLCLAIDHTHEEDQIFTDNLLNSAHEALKAFLGGEMLERESLDIESLSQTKTHPSAEQKRSYIEALVSEWLMSVSEARLLSTKERDAIKSAHEAYPGLDQISLRLVMSDHEKAPCLLAKYIDPNTQKVFEAATGLEYGRVPNSDELQRIKKDARFALWNQTAAGKKETHWSSEAEKARKHRCKLEREIVALIPDNIEALIAKLSVWHEDAKESSEQILDYTPGECVVSALRALEGTKNVRDFDPDKPSKN